MFASVRGSAVTLHRNLERTHVGIRLKMSTSCTLQLDNLICNVMS